MNDLISRCELFNRLATVQTLGDAYAVIQGMETADLDALILDPLCDRLKELLLNGATDYAKGFGSAMRIVAQIIDGEIDDG